MGGQPWDDAQCRSGFAPHPNLSDSVNRNLVQSEVEGGVYLDKLGCGSALHIQTENRRYTVVHRGQGDAVIWGHPIYCPVPVKVKISGSNWGGSMLKVGFIGRGMHLEFRHPRYRAPVITSRIQEIQEIAPEGKAELARIAAQA